MEATRRGIASSNAVIERHQRDRKLARIKLPATPGTSQQSMRAVLQYLADRAAEDGTTSRLRQYHEVSIAQHLRKPRRTVAAALHALDSLRIITLARSSDRVSVCINWCTLDDYLPLSAEGSR